MEDATADRGALGEAVVFLDHFKEMPDPRQRGKVMYPLDEVLLLALPAVLAGARHPMTTSATSSPPWTRSTSNVVSWPGSPH
jgi:hypothetical protein